MNQSINTGIFPSKLKLAKVIPIYKKDNKTLQRAFAKFGKVLQVKADDNIEDKDTRIMRAIYPTCIGTYFARRYAVGLLMRSLRDVYKGSVVITGEPKMKPYDRCYIYDSYRDMYGPIEIEQVTHIFSKDTGFITEIKPDMVVHFSNIATMGTLEAMWEVSSEVFKSAVVRENKTAIAGGIAAATILTGGIGLLLGLYGGYKLTQQTQIRQPIIVSPLTLGHKPYMAGLTGYKRDSLLVNLKGRWRRFTTEIKDGWNELWETGAIKTWFLENVGNRLQ